MATQDQVAIAQNAARDAARVQSFIKVQTLAEGNPVDIDVAGGSSASIILTGDAVIGPITNASPGQTGSILITQDSTGGHGVTYDNSIVDMSNNVSDYGSQGADKRSILSWITFDGSTFFAFSHHEE